MQQEPPGAKRLNTNLLAAPAVSYDSGVHAATELTTQTAAVERCKSQRKRLYA